MFGSYLITLIEYHLWHLLNDRHGTVKYIMYFHISQTAHVSSILYKQIIVGLKLMGTTLTPEILIKNTTEKVLQYSSSDIQYQYIEYPTVITAGFT